VINPEVPRTDVVSSGRNDVVNLAGQDDPTAPCTGMPVLEVDQGPLVFVGQVAAFGSGDMPASATTWFELPQDPSMVFGDASSCCQRPDPEPCANSTVVWQGAWWPPARELAGPQEVVQTGLQPIRQPG